MLGRSPNAAQRSFFEIAGDAATTGSYRGLQQRIMPMKHLLAGVTVVAALAFSAPVGAQPANPSGGNALGLPGPNPGGPGLTPYSSGPARSVAAPPAAAPPPAATMPPPSAPTATSAMPPTHRHARASSHGKAAGHYGKGPKLTGSSANQLNQEELARLQAGNFSNPAAPPGPPPGPGVVPPPTGSGRMPVGGGKTN